MSAFELPPVVAWELELRAWTTNRDAALEPGDVREGWDQVEHRLLTPPEHRVTTHEFGIEVTHERGGSHQVRSVSKSFIPWWRVAELRVVRAEP